jgi:predicted nucleic acid-binding protein
LPCVLDTSVAIDLDEGACLEAIFGLPWQFAVPDVLLAAEYLSLDAGQLVASGLAVQNLSGEQVLAVVALRQQHPRLSANDLFAYVLARDLDATLLTGDGNLRALAEATGVSCHGTLWLLDELVHHELLPPDEAADALMRMLAGGSRLPATECSRRLGSWRAG